MRISRKWVYRNEVAIEVDTNLPPRKAVAPSIRCDSMAACMHPATGKIIDSKSEFRKMTKQSGCVEIGNDYDNYKAPREEFDDDQLDRDVRTAYNNLEWGATPKPDSHPEFIEDLKL